MLAIQTTALTRRLDAAHGVHDLDLAVPEGSIYGFLGPNGAGKTTTIRLLLGLLRPDSGEIRVFGQRLAPGAREPLRAIGSMVEGPALYPHLSGRENLAVTGHLLALPAERIDEVLDTVGLAQDQHRRVRVYSLGMRQRLGIALALLGQPRLLVLDEPTNGLDPAGIVALRALLQRLVAASGVTVFVSSHLLAEVEQVASHVGVLHRGRLLFQGTPQALRSRYGDPLTIRCDDACAAGSSLADLGESAEVMDACTLRLAMPTRPDHEINGWLVRHGYAVHALGRSGQSLESLFFRMTGEACAA